MISTQYYERVARTLGCPLYQTPRGYSLEFKRNGETLAVDGHLNDPAFLRSLHNALMPRALDFLLKTEASDPRRGDIVTLFNLG